MSLATTMRPPAALYREEQPFAWWVYAALAVMAAAGLASLAWSPEPGRGDRPLPDRSWEVQVPIALAVGVVLPSILIVGVLRMTTEVTPDACHVWFGWIPTYRRTLPIEAVRAVEVVRFRPIVDYGFWGAHTSRDGEHILIARGDRGVRVVLTDGTRYLIGSQRPEDLALAIRGAMPPDK